MSVSINSLKLATGNIPGAGDTWHTVPLPYKYREMVVIATPQYWDEKLPVVVRIRNAEGSRFEMRVENPAGAGGLDGYVIQYMVVEAGVYRHNLSGIKIEARRLESGVTASASNWVAQQTTYRQLYDDPIVVGQVMTSHDRWSAFWAHGDSHLSPPNRDTIFVGKHVGEDPQKVRQNETLGIVVFEAGEYQINGINIEAKRSPNNVGGRTTAVVPQQLRRTGITAVASSAGMNGNDGAWPVLWGDTRTKPFNSKSLAMVVDEDQLRDEEQNHVVEEINFVVLDPTPDVARFMAQASMGADLTYMQFVARTGYPIWLRYQKNNTSVSLTKPYMAALDAHQLTTDPESNAGEFDYQWSRPYAGRPFSSNFSTIWMRNIVNRNDYLRQRVAWSLSQIFVVSYRDSALIYAGTGMADFYDILSRNALGNFRNLLYEISTNALMTYYLSSLGNRKADPERNRYPDENFAREIMQLFTIGLWELNIDGTRKMVDADGRPCDPLRQDNLSSCEPIPTYDDEDIQELARVFTGLWFEDRPFGTYQGSHFRAHAGFRPLIMFEDQHDQDAKVLFHDKQHETHLPANNGGMQDMKDAIDLLFNHPNVPPFISKQLIQFLVTSNPSRAYIRRVAQVFKNNGEGVRGDLSAVVNAILLDQEARYYGNRSGRRGKLMEPMVRLSRMVKAFRAGRGVPDFQFWEHQGQSYDFGQWPLFSRTVFSFFEPDYSHPGVLRDTGLSSPEFQILNPVTATTMANRLIHMIDVKIHRTQRGNPPDFKFDFSFEIALALAEDISGLIDRLDLLLCYGQMTEGTRNVIINGIERVTPAVVANPEHRAAYRVRLAVWLTAVSADAAVLH